MRKKRNFLSKINSKNLAFISLIVIFGILLLQTAISLFIEVEIEAITQIDIVFRTALSSIFGYFMSMVSVSEFAIKNKRKTYTKSNNKPKSIGFSSEKSDNPQSFLTLEEEKAKDLSSEISPSIEEKQPVQRKFTVNVQIIVLACVCLFCLIVMLIVRNFSHMIAPHSSNTVTISLFRDFISGSIGALIGLSRSSSNQ